MTAIKAFWESVFGDIADIQLKLVDLDKRVGNIEQCLRKGDVSTCILPYYAYYQN